MDRILPHTARFRTASTDAAVGLDRRAFVACPAGFFAGYSQGQYAVAISLYELAAFTAMQQVARDEARQHAAIHN